MSNDCSRTTIEIGRRARNSSNLGRCGGGEVEDTRRAEWEWERERGGGREGTKKSVSCACGKARVRVYIFSVEQFAYPRGQNGALGSIQQMKLDGDSLGHPRSPGRQSQPCNPWSVCCPHIRARAINKLIRLGMIDLSSASLTSTVRRAHGR